MRGVAHRLLVLLVVPLCALALGSCGDSSVNLETTVKAKDKDTSVKPGEQHQYVVTVVNKGPAQATRVNVHVDLPGGFRYKATISIDGDGARTQPVDAAVNSASPEWGSWSLAAPGIANDGSEHDASVVLTFSAEAGGKPGTYQLQAKASGDNTEGDVTSAPLVLELSAAPKLSVAVAAQPSAVHVNDFVNYRVTITNDGTGPANGVAVLVTMPAMLAYADSRPPEGNSSQSNKLDPIKNTSAPFFGTYTIPAKSDSGPGVLALVFRAKVVPAGTAGSFPVSVQVTDCNGTPVNQCNDLVAGARDTSPVIISS